MFIQFISSLAPEEEAQIAPALVSGIAAVLACIPIAYAVRIDTTGGLTFLRTHAEPPPAPPRRNFETDDDRDCGLPVPAMAGHNRDLTTEP